MGRLIDADALLEQVQLRTPVDSIAAEIVCDCVDITRRIIKKAPTVDAVEVVHGRWLTTEGYPHRLYCSQCYKIAVPNVEILKDWEIEYSYCPGCGAKMDGGNKDG